MPDVHCGSFKRLAPFRIHKRDSKLKRNAGLSLGNVVTGFPEIDVVRAFFLFRTQRASSCGGKNSRCRGNGDGASDHERAPVEIHIEL